MNDRPSQLGLTERLDQGPLVCAEGYLFEFERRGYLQAGAFVPEVVLDHPDLVSGLHREFVHAGSDVVPAFTYYGHREKLRMVGKEDLLEPLNREALTLAVEVATEAGVLSAGDLCNTNLFGPDRASQLAVRGMFEEQMSWVADAGVDFVIAETFSFGAEALIALECDPRDGAARGGDARRPPGRRDARRVEPRGGLPAAGRCRRRGGGPQLHPGAEDDAAADRAHPGARSTSTSRRCRCPTVRRPRSRASGRCAILTATVSPTVGRFRPRWTRSPAIGMRSPSSPRRRIGSASTTSASAVAPGRITSGRWPKPWGRFRRPAGTAPTCPSTHSWAAMRCSRTTTVSSRPTSDAWVAALLARVQPGRVGGAQPPEARPAAPDASGAAAVAAGRPRDEPGGQRARRDDHGQVARPSAAGSAPARRRAGASAPSPPPRRR